MFRQHAALKQMQNAPVFAGPVPIPAESAEDVLRGVLAGAGCSHERDAVDERVVKSVRKKEFLPVARSQNDVGGWPVLK